MRSSPDTDARPFPHRVTSRSAHLRQTLFLLALLLAGVVISFVVVRYIDPPRAGALSPEQPAARPSGALPA